jgi:farnesyl diphosphate synthase
MDHKRLETLRTNKVVVPSRRRIARDLEIGFEEHSDRSHSRRRSPLLSGEPSNSNEFDLRLAIDRQHICDSLAQLLAGAQKGHSASHNDNSNRKLRETIEYATLGPGKRIRPLLALRVARLLEADTEFVLRAALAVELVHCASLVIDDLPCMDNGEFRRGRPAVHVRFGESTAILAAFSMVALAADSVLAGATDSAQMVRLIEFQRGLLKVFGCNSLVGGQAWDLQLNKCQRRQKAESLANQKTAPLVELAASAGCISSRKPVACNERLVHFGRTFGVFFQLIDDLHDGDQPAQSLLQSEFARLRQQLNALGPNTAELAHLLDHLGVHPPDAAKSNGSRIL